MNETLENLILIGVLSLGITIIYVSIVIDTIPKHCMILQTITAMGWCIAWRLKTELGGV